MKHWLLKSEPETYSFESLLKSGRTNWDQIRNFQARNFLRQMSVGDLALIYHSGEERAVVGIARVTRAAYPDIDPEGGDWSQVDLAAERRIARSVTLTELKAEPALRGLLLIKQSRLSAMPITPAEYATILKLAERPAPVLTRSRSRAPSEALPRGRRT